MIRAVCNQLIRRARDARRSARLAPEADLLAWGQRYLPSHFTRPANDMHRWLSEHLTTLHLERGTKINLLGPRGSAKSTLGTLAYPLRAALEGWEPYIWIISDTAHQARAHLENIKTEVLENRQLRVDYAQSARPGRVWRSGAIMLSSGAMIEAFGTGQRLRGRRRRADRPTLIVCDDLQNDGHMQSPLQRDHCRNWFHGTLLKAGTSRTNFIELATALHREALAVELTRNAGWTSRTFQAIEAWPSNMALWEQWESVYADLSLPDSQAAARQFYESHRAELEAGAKVLWPEEEDLYALMRMRAESGHTSFAREKQNEPLSPESCEWPESYFSDAVWFDQWPSALRIKTLAVDPSKGKDSRRGDYAAFVMLGVDAGGLLYVEAELARLSAPEIVSHGVELHRRFAPDAFGVEANQFQELLASELEAEFRRQGMLDAQPWAVHNQTAKNVRIRRLGPFLAGCRLRFKNNSSGTRLLVDQLREFPAAGHDDGPDALEMAVRLAAELQHGRGADDGLGDRLPVG